MIKELNNSELENVTGAGNGDSVYVMKCNHGRATQAQTIILKTKDEVAQKYAEMMAKNYTCQLPSNYNG